MIHLTPEVNSSANRTTAPGEKTNVRKNSGRERKNARKREQGRIRERERERERGREKLRKIQ